jgi:predicted HTH transcriptional regulator
VLEFKEDIPIHANLAKTIAAFANAAGGELYVGVRNTTRKIVGLPEDEPVSWEEQISNIIYLRCYPAILPEITFLTDDGKHLRHLQAPLKKNQANNPAFSTETT